LHGTGTRVQEHIGDPVSDAPSVARQDLEDIFQDIQKDARHGPTMHRLSWPERHQQTSRDP
jgi:hypothetical protein